MQVAQKIASLILARANCLDRSNTEWADRHGETLAAIMRDAPSGGGFDNGTVLHHFSSPETLRFITSFHHMDAHGSYDGWTDHAVTVKASLALGLDLRVSGRDRNGIKDYIHETFQTWLSSGYEERAQ